MIARAGFLQRRSISTPGLLCVMPDLPSCSQHDRLSGCYCLVRHDGQVLSSCCIKGVSLHYVLLSSVPVNPTLLPSMLEHACCSLSASGTACRFSICSPSVWCVSSEAMPLLEQCVYGGTFEVSLAVKDCDGQTRAFSKSVRRLNDRVLAHIHSIAGAVIASLRRAAVWKI